MTNRKALALLVYIVNTTQGAESRQRLAGLFGASRRRTRRARPSARRSPIFDTSSDRWRMMSSRPTGSSSASSGIMATDSARLKRELQMGRIDPMLLERKRICEAFLAGFDDLDPLSRLGSPCSANVFTTTTCGFLRTSPAVRPIFSR